MALGFWTGENIVEGMKSRIVIEDGKEVIEYFIDGDWKREGDRFYIFGNEVVVSPESITGLKTLKSAKN